MEADRLQLEPDCGEIETAPGLFVRRRSLIAVVAGIVAASVATPAAAALAGLAEDGALPLDRFLAEINPIAKRLAADTSLAGQDRYLLTVAAHAVRLIGVPVPEMRDSGQGPGALIGVNPGGDPFTILHWRLMPHARIRPHAHTYGNVVTLGLEGEARVENFEMAGTRDFSSSSGFVARRTRSQRLTPGAVNLVNLERDYIHGFTTDAGGARGLDITTRLQPRAPTPYLDLGKALAGRQDEYKAAWQFDEARDA